MTAKSITDIYYLTHQQTHSDALTHDILSKLCELFCLLDATALDIRKAISAETVNFEDALMKETTISNHIDYIVTRNANDYKKATIPVYEPKEFIKRLLENKES